MPKSASELNAEIKQALAQKSSDQGFETFASWQSVLDAARRGDRLWYHAPMDLRPLSIAVDRVFKNGKIRINPLSNQVDKFTADAGHLSRFRRRP